MIFPLITMLGCGRPAPAARVDEKRVQVTLIGASIGQSWRLAEWPDRVHAPGFVAESLAVWQFDKTEAIEELLMRPRRKLRLTRTYLKSLVEPPPPRADVVILKECSSYFPYHAGSYRRSVQNWVRQLQERNARVVLATVVPVTRARAAREPGKQEALLEYNRWVREYAREQNLPVLDLESALSEPGEGSYLRDSFALPDGSHLNSNAYAVLDQALRTLLCRAAPASGCAAAPAAAAAR